ncbi:helix-turn-helix domain-containing protein [Nocardia sp. NPDC005366]|uniref:helix-turn-helix domain-containing protein n=1 Tax=Nocardia sp. NPDC005366 TaxID=3156878 RepID=UPI0033AD4F7F
MTSNELRDDYYYATGRESRALFAVVQHRAMQPDVLAKLLGTGRNHVYEMLSGLREGGMVEPLRKVGAGPKWIVPTRKAIRQMLGRPLPDWTPSRLWSVRARATALTRIALGATGMFEWESERELRYFEGYEGRFLFEGRAHLGDSLVAVRVDIGSSPTASNLTETVVRAVRTAPDFGSGLLWVCAGDTQPDAVLRTVDRLTRTGVLDNDSALRIAAVDYDDLTDPNVPVITPWGVA